VEVLPLQNLGEAPSDSMSCAKGTRNDVRKAITKDRHGVRVAFGAVPGWASWILGTHPIS
jgi:hypothetical protein